MYQIYTHPKYIEHGKKFFEGVNERYTEYAKRLEPKIGIPYTVITPLIFIFVRACVHYAMFEDEYYLKSQMEVLKQGSPCLRISTSKTKHSRSAAACSRRGRRCKNSAVIIPNGGKKMKTGKETTHRHTFGALRGSFGALHRACRRMEQGGKTDAALPEVRNSGTAIQWKYSDEADWRDLVALSELRALPEKNGKDGANGKTARTESTARMAPTVRTE